MHARIDQLLSVLDCEPVDATVHAHLEQCQRCRAQLTALTRDTEQLRALPQLEAPKQSWQRIAARLDVEPRRSQWRARSGIAAVAAGVVGLVVAITQWGDLQVDRFGDAAQQFPGGDSSRQQLMQRSRELERELEYLPQRPAVERPALAVTVDAIEQRVQWLDWRLSIAPEAQLNEEQARVLWRERVTLMDSLVKLRYAESRWASF